MLIRVGLVLVAEPRARTVAHIVNVGLVCYEAGQRSSRVATDEALVAARTRAARRVIGCGDGSHYAR